MGLKVTFVQADGVDRRLRDLEDQIEFMMIRDTQSKIVSALLKLSGGRSGAVLPVTPLLTYPPETDAHYAVTAVDAPRRVAHERRGRRNTTLVVVETRAATRSPFRSRESQVKKSAPSAGSCTPRRRSSRSPPANCRPRGRR